MQWKLGGNRDLRGARSAYYETLAWSRISVAMRDFKISPGDSSFFSELG